MTEKIRNRKRAAFTLVEMLVVIGIIALLMGALSFGYSKMVKSARKARTQELVSNAAAALTQLFQKGGGVWPKDIEDAAKGEDGILDEKACRPLARNGYLGLSYNQDDIRNGEASQIELKGQDRCGLVDPETAKMLATHKTATAGSKVSSGGTVKDHILHFAIDHDGTGFVKAKPEGAKGTLTIRATAVVWAAGPDGKVDYSAMGRNDDVYSWRAAQVSDSK